MFVIDTIADIYVFFVLYNERMVHSRARGAELRPEHKKCFLFYLVTNERSQEEQYQKKKKPPAGEKRREKREREREGGRDEEQQQQPSQSSHGYGMACMS